MAKRIILTDEEKALTQTIVRRSKFYDWGSNCKVLGYTKDQADRILDDWYPSLEDVNIHDLDAFWDGFHNSERTSVVFVHGL